VTAQLLRLPTREERGRAAYDRAIASGNSALDATLARIATQFDAYACHEANKDRVREILAAGPNDIENRARFRTIARSMTGETLMTACRRLAVMIAADRFRGYRVDQGVLAEAHLALRYLRRHHPCAWNGLCDRIGNPIWAPRVADPETERAATESGYAPLSDYVAKHSKGLDA
jgi:hypothetical protein